MHLIYLLKSPVSKALFLRPQAMCGFHPTPTSTPASSTSSHSHHLARAIPENPRLGSSSSGTLCPDLKQMQPWRLHLDRIPLLRLGEEQCGHHQIVLLSDKPACLPRAAPPSALAVSCRNAWHKKDPSLMGPSCLKVGPCG